MALLRAQRVLDTLEASEDERVGVRILRRALEEPLRAIAHNAGENAAVVVEKVRESEGAYGYNAATGTFEDLLAAGVIDPTKVVRSALQNAGSVAGLMLTTEALIADKLEESAALGSGMPGSQPPFSG